MMMVINILPLIRLLTPVLVIAFTIHKKRGDETAEEVLFFFVITHHGDTLILSSGINQFITKAISSIKYSIKPLCTSTLFFFIRNLFLLFLFFIIIIIVIISTQKKQ